MRSSRPAGAASSGRGSRGDGPRLPAAAPASFSPLLPRVAFRGGRSGAGEEAEGPFSPWPRARPRCPEAPPGGRAAAAEPWSGGERRGAAEAAGPGRARSSASLAVPVPGDAAPGALDLSRAQQLRGPRAAEPRLFMADPPSGGAPAAAAGRGAGGGTAGGGGGGPPCRSRGRSPGRASEPLPPGTLRERPARPARGPVSALGAPRGRRAGRRPGARRGGGGSGGGGTGVPRPPPGAGQGGARPSGQVSAGRTEPRRAPPALSPLPPPGPSPGERPERRTPPPPTSGAGLDVTLRPLSSERGAQGDDRRPRGAGGREGRAGAALGGRASPRAAGTGPQSGSHAGPGAAGIWGNLPGFGGIGRDLGESWLRGASGRGGWIAGGRWWGGGRGAGAVRVDVATLSPQLPGTASPPVPLPAPPSPVPAPRGDPPDFRGAQTPPLLGSAPSSCGQTRRWEDRSFPGAGSEGSPSGRGAWVPGLPRGSAVGLGAPALGVGAWRGALPGRR